MRDNELFSAYLRLHDEKTVSVEAGNAMYIDSFSVSDLDRAFRFPASSRVLIPFISLIIPM
jgi:hypothetical protein